MRIFVPTLIITASLALTTGALAADSKATAPATKATPATPATKATPATPATPALKASAKAAPKQITGTKEECEKAYAAETHHRKSKANFMKACVKPTPKT